LQTITKTLNINYNDTLSGTWRLGRIQKQQASVKLFSAGGDIVPDVRGLGLKDALQILESNGWNVSIVGSGKVVNQSVTAGLSGNKNQPIILYLN